LRRAIAQVTLITLIGQVFGLVREIVYAAYFGVSHEFDVLNVSLNAISSVATALASIPLFVIPWLTSARASRQEERFAQILTSIVLCLAVVAVPTVMLVEIFPNRVLAIIAPGVSSLGDSQDLGVLTLRVMTPQILLYTLTYVTKALANMYASYMVVATESIITNLAIIGVVVLGHKLAPSGGILYVVAGYYVGLTAYCCLCFMAVVKRHGSDTLKWSFNAAVTTDLARGVLGFSLATLVAYLTPVIFYRFASTTGVGGVSVVSYASRILTVSIGTVTSSVMLVYFPRVTRELSEGKQRSVATGLYRLTGALYSMSLFVSVVLVAFGKDLVSVLYVKGSFKKESAELLCSLFPYYVPWILSYPITTVFHYVFMGAKRYSLILGVELLCAILACAVGNLFASHGVRGVSLLISTHRVGIAVLLVVLASRFVPFTLSAYLRALMRPTAILALWLTPIAYGYVFDRSVLFISALGAAAMLLWNAYGQYLRPVQAPGALP
jgi:putative peptidoglycan lipid II flippase